jgi:hypothetical protein
MTATRRPAALALAAACAIAVGGSLQAQDWRLVDAVIPRGGGAFDAVRNRLVVLGKAGDTREWDGVRWLHRPLPRVPGSILQQVFDSTRGVLVAICGDGPLGGAARTWECDGNTWSLRATPMSPPQLLSGAAAFDPVRGCTVLFGGGFLPGNATWEWNGATWQQRTPTNAPPVRSAPALAFDSARARTVMFGGHVINGFTTTYFRDTWEWDGTNWQQRFPVTVPSGRSGHRLAFDAARARTVMFGSYSGTAAETWEYDGATWLQRTGPMPSQRSFPGLAYDSHRARTVLFGGSASTPTDDVWEWDGTTWQQRAANPAPMPQVSTAPASAYSANRDRLVLFGGYDGAANAADTWEWDGSGWTRLAPPTSPPGRYQHSMWSDGGDVFVFGGGLPGSQFGNDTWRFDGTTWTAMPSAGLPPARHSAAVAFDPATGGALLFGGTRPGVTLTHYGDTWQWTALGWSAANPATAPAPRSNAAIAGDPLRHRIVLWGGFGANGGLDDTWEWDGVNWTQQNPTHRPPLGSWRSMVFEPTYGAIALLTTASSSDNTVQTWLWSGTDWVRLSPPSPPVALATISATAGPGRVRLYDGARLYELTMLPPMAAAYGTSCPGPGPLLLVDAWPRPGASDFGLASTAHAPNAPVFVVLGTAAANGTIAGCPLWVQPGGPIVALTADALGNCTWSLPLAPLPALVGLEAFAQAWSLGAAGSMASNGVDVRIGQ